MTNRGECTPTQRFSTKVHSLPSSGAHGLKVGERDPFDCIAVIPGTTRAPAALVNNTIIFNHHGDNLVMDSNPT